MKTGKITKTVCGVLGWLLALIVVSPLVFCVLTSFMTEAELYASSLWPASFDFFNYRTSLSLAPLGQFMVNSLSVSTVCTLFQLLTGALAGYAFGLLKFKGQKVIFYFFLATMMIPGNAIIIANYLTMAQWKLLDTFYALVLPYLTSAFCIFNMRQAFKSLPQDLFEASVVDGCNSFLFFWRIGLPLTVPSLGALGVYTFLSVWNQYMWPLLVTNKVTLRTVQIGIGMLQNADGMAYGPVMAATTMILIPSVIIFALGQKTLLSGLTAGAVKG